MTVVNGLTPGAPAGGDAPAPGPVPVRGSRAVCPVRLQGCFRARYSFPTVSGPGLAVGGGIGQSRVVPQQSP